MGMREGDSLSAMTES